MIVKLLDETYIVIEIVPRFCDSPWFKSGLANVIVGRVGVVDVSLAPEFNAVHSKRLLASLCSRVHHDGGVKSIS